MFKGSIVALITPFEKNGRVDEKALRELVNWHIEKGSSGIVCCGTTGESPTLSDEEKIKIFSVCVEEGKGKIPIIAGTGSYDTKKTYLLTKKAKEIGCRGALVVVPYYNKPTQLGILAHFQQISKANLPIIVYHHPGRTGVKILPQTFSLLENIKNIVAIKEASGSILEMQKVKKSCNIPILSGDDNLTFASILAGADGAISVVANIIPDIWKKMINSAIKKQTKIANEINQKYYSLVDAMFLESNPQCVKYALFLMNKCKNIYRLPLLEPSFSNQEKIKQIMRINNCE